MADTYDNRSLGDLLSELSRETGTLVKKEVELATTEMTAKLRSASRDAAAVGAGGALAHAGLLLLLAALVLGLSQLGIAPWLSALIIGLLTIIVGTVLVMMGISALRRTGVAPTHTIETLKEDARWTTGQRA